MTSIYEIIEKMINERRINNKEPAMVSTIAVKDEVLRQAREELRELEQSGKIRRHRTVNGYSISIIEQ